MRRTADREEWRTEESEQQRSRSGELQSNVKSLKLYMLRSSGLPRISKRAGFRRRPVETVEIPANDPLRNGSLQIARSARVIFLTAMHNPSSRFRWCLGFAEI